MKLITHEAWNHNPNICRYDDDLVELANREAWSDKRVFHMGSGIHHLVGRSLSEKNDVLSITNSPLEMAAFVTWQIDNPKNYRYHCMFGDIYKMNIRLMPMFNVISLPHLGEMMDEKRDEYDALAPDEVLSLLIGCLFRNGQIFAYRNSSAWDRMEKVFERLNPPYLVSENIIGWRVE